MTRIHAVALTVAAAMAATACPARADEAAAIDVSRAWTPVQTATGVDTPLFMTVANHGATPDALLRASCPVATFIELRVVDHGEGVPAPRLVKNIAIPVDGAFKLEPDGPRIMLLQTTETLAAGAAFSCKLTFRNAGAVEVAVQVGEPKAEASR